MNNDLISRSYLKNLPFERVIHTDFGETAIPIEEIDNAPTVDLWQMRQEATENALKKAEVLYTRPQGESVIKCQDCKYQKKYWHEDKRMKEKGYWIYGCELIDDHFVGTPVWGGDNQFCSSAVKKGGADNEHL